MLVIPPATTDLEVSRRKSFATESETGDERDRAGVARLDARLDPVQSERPKALVQH